MNITALGEDHIDLVIRKCCKVKSVSPIHTILSMTAFEVLGQCFLLQEKYDEAEKLFIRAADIKEKNLEHPDVTARG